MDEGLLASNLEILGHVQEESGAKIILALKGFAMWSCFPLLRNVLHGTTASSMNEAILGRDEFGREVHVYCVAYREDELRTYASFARHITLNSLSQLRQMKAVMEDMKHKVSFGLRINPEYSEVQTPLYNPCRPGSRFGVHASEFLGEDLSIIEGLHFHTLCEQGADTLERTLVHVEEKFGKWLHQMKWLNLGGGHHITRADYDRDLLIRLVKYVRSTYDIDIYLEPGEAVALDSGFLVSTVLDVINSGDHTLVILDTSATAHMPDVLEMPYRPEILGSDKPGEKAWTATLGGLSCLAGDVIGDWSFEKPLRVGDQLVFTDMAHYSMVKTTMFNGVQHPAICLARADGRGARVVREFVYEDLRNRLS